MPASCSRTRSRQYLYNGPEYLESMFAAFKAGLVPVNTNYRYVDDELVYLWDNADAVAVVFHGTFAERIEGIRDRVPRVRAVAVGRRRRRPVPRRGPTPYEAAADDRAPTRVVGAVGPRRRRPALLYTGGTTGMPKGVMWRQDDLFRNVVGAGVNPRVRDGDGRLRASSATRCRRPGIDRRCPACPLMHGTGWFTQLIVLSGGGCDRHPREPHASTSTSCSTPIEREKVNTIAIVGDAFAKPIAAGPRRRPRPLGPLQPVRSSRSSGVMCQRGDQAGPARATIPAMMIVDAFSLVGGGRHGPVGVAAPAARSRHGQVHARREHPGHHRRRPTTSSPARARSGRVAVGGFQPDRLLQGRGQVGGDVPHASTGERYSVPGDYATVEADGTLTLLGRGSVCINTGGEKVFPEEVEEVLKTHADGADAVAVGVPDEKFGEAITAVVELVPGADARRGRRSSPT